METIHLEFPKKDGILLTKKGLMKVNYYKELVVVKPLGKSKASLDLLRSYLRQKLMRELKLDQLNHRQQTESMSNSEEGSSPESRGRSLLARVRAGVVDVADEHGDLI